MTKGRGYPVISVIAGLIAAAALVFFFTAPAKYIGKMEETMGYGIRQAKDAVMAGDMRSAENSIEEIYIEFQRRQDKLQLICHHDNIDEMEQSIKCCRDLVKLGQSDNLICELNELEQVLEHINSVENADIYEVF